MSSAQTDCIVLLNAVLHEHARFAELGELVNNFVDGTFGLIEEDTYWYVAARSLAESLTQSHTFTHSLGLALSLTLSHSQLLLCMCATATGKRFYCSAANVTSHFKDTISAQVLRTATE